MLGLPISILAYRSCYAAARRALPARAPVLASQGLAPA
jgi:hypothetical protein